MIATYPGGVKHFLLYTGARLGLLLVVGGLAYAVGMRGFLLLVAAFIGSGVVSFFVLRGPRSELGSDVGGFFRRINDRIDEASRKEDVPAGTAGPDQHPTDGVPPAGEQTKDSTGTQA